MRGRTQGGEFNGKRLLTPFGVHVADLKQARIDVPRYEVMIGGQLNEQLKLFAYMDISHPMVAWEAYVGRFISADLCGQKGFHPLSRRHVSMLKRLRKSGSDSLVVAEARMELARARLSPGSVSRLTGLYFFESKEDAERAQAKWKVRSFKKENLAEVSVSAVRVTRVDSEWVTHCNQREDDEWLKSYWNSEIYETEPLWEILVSGIGCIQSTGFRERAYEVIKARFPGSLGLLELSRVAFDMGFSLGQVVAFATRMEKGKYLLSYLMDFRDGRNPEFLDAFREYKGPRNTADLGPRSNLVTLDLKPLAFEFALPSHISYPLVSTEVPNHS